eukprot:15364563-Ditylum_brightwellii.AAC.1
MAKKTQMRHWCYMQCRGSGCKNWYGFIVLAALVTGYVFSVREITMKQWLSFSLFCILGILAKDEEHRTGHCQGYQINNGWCPPLLKLQHMIEAASNIKAGCQYKISPVVEDIENVDAVVAVTVIAPQLVRDDGNVVSSLLSLSRLIAWRLAFGGGTEAELLTGAHMRIAALAFGGRSSRCSGGTTVVLHQNQSWVWHQKQT